MPSRRKKRPKVGRELQSPAGGRRLRGKQSNWKPPATDDDEEEEPRAAGSNGKAPAAAAVAGSSSGAQGSGAGTPARAPATENATPAGENAPGQPSGALTPAEASPGGETHDAVEQLPAAGGGAGAEANGGTPSSSDDSDSSRSLPRSAAQPQGAVRQLPARNPWKMQYTIQWSHSTIPGRANPETMEKAEFGGKLITASAALGLEVEKVIVSREIHASGKPNYYAGIICAQQFAFAPLADFLRENYQIYASFGTTHAYFWSVVVYGGVPTEHKRLEELDPSPWHSQGLTVRQELEDIPRGARLGDKIRVRAFLGLPAPGGAPRGVGNTGRGGRPEDAMPRHEFAELAVSKAWTSREQVTTGVRDLRATDPRPYNFLLALGANRTEELLEWIWELEGKAANGEGDRLEKLRAICAFLGPCCSAFGGPCSLAAPKHFSGCCRAHGVAPAPSEPGEEEQRRQPFVPREDRSFVARGDEIVSCVDGNAAA